MQICEFLGYCKNLYDRLHAIYKDIPFISVVVGNSKNSFYIAHSKYKTHYNIIGKPKYFYCNKDSMLVKTLDFPFYFYNDDGNVVYQNYDVVSDSDWTSFNTEDEVIADVACWLHKLDGIKKRYLIEHICKEKEDDNKLY